MVGGLFRQLVKALGLFIRYQLSRIFRRQQRPAELICVASRKQIASLKHGVDLDRSYTKIVPWSTDWSDLSESDIASNPIFQLWSKTPQGHKWTHYFDAYQAIFESWRSRPMRILEIGVLQGASLLLWKKYFQHPETSVVGIDIDPACARFDEPAERIHVRIGSQADAEFLDRVVEEFGPFDLIIDDGSHYSTHMIISFNCLYARGLKDDGIYFVEDLHANYWFPWRDSAKSFLDFCKDLLEHMHSHYGKADWSAWVREQESGTSLVLDVPEITTMIKEMRFFDSIVAIYKTRRAHLPRYIVR